MTIPVPIDALAAVLRDFDHAYLITQRGLDEYAKVLTVDPFMRGDELVIATERDSVRGHVASDDRVTLIWPPTKHHGHSLIVDGRGSLAAGEIRIAIHHAILHRPGAPMGRIGSSPADQGACSAMTTWVLPRSPIPHEAFSTSAPSLGAIE